MIGLVLNFCDRLYFLIKCELRSSLSILVFQQFLILLCTGITVRTYPAQYTALFTNIEFKTQRIHYTKPTRSCWKVLVHVNVGNSINYHTDEVNWLKILTNHCTWRRYVSFEFLKGTCSSLFANANITSAKDDKLLLMAWLQKISKIILKKDRLLKN